MITTTMSSARFLVEPARGGRMVVRRHGAGEAFVHVTKDGASAQVLLSAKERVEMIRALGGRPRESLVNAAVDGIGAPVARKARR